MVLLSAALSHDVFGSTHIPEDKKPALAAILGISHGSASGTQPAANAHKGFSIKVFLFGFQMFSYLDNTARLENLLLVYNYPEIALQSLWSLESWNVLMTFYC